MKHARIAWAGAVHHAIEREGQLELQTPAFKGRLLNFDEGIWLPPLVDMPPHRPRTVLALAINYADHAKELAFKPPEEPLAFAKGAASLIGHRAFTVRPADATNMHYECELAVVIGRSAKAVRAADAMAHVAGYTVCNDYAVRDYLENWYRPNLRVKNRDGGTVLGPWFVEAADVPDPHALQLRTLVNGQCTQQGNTANMVNRIPALIEYLSSFMTLQAGDVILTGTPDGVVNVNVGDTVVTEIDGIGRLVNHIDGDAVFGR